MSVLGVGEAVPSRIAGVFKYLLRCERRREKRQSLEEMLSPDRLRPPEGGIMVKRVIDECNKMKLTEEDKANEMISLSQTAWDKHPGTDFDPHRFRTLLICLIMDPVNAENHDLCRLMAWFLAQNVTTIRGDQEGLEKALRQQIGPERLGLTSDVRYGNFRDWSVFLRLAWAHKLLVGSGLQLVPDPTNYIESQLPDLGANAPRGVVALPEFVSKMASRCPVLEGGCFYDAISQWLPEKAPELLSSATSLALLRLERRRVIKLEKRSDAPGMVIKAGSESRRITHLHWLGRNVGGK